jgi:hypothetical protein
VDSPQPTAELAELKAAVAELQAEIADLRETASTIEGALNALVVVYTVRRLPTRPGQAPADSEPSD